MEKLYQIIHRHYFFHPSVTFFRVSNVGATKNIGEMDAHPRHHELRPSVSTFDRAFGGS